MKRLLVAILALISFILFVNRGYAQSSKALAEAEKYFGIRNYEEALPLFTQAIQAGEKDPNVHYKAGVCYQKSTSTDEQSKAIPFFEYAVKNGAKVPVSTYYDLGILYQRNEDIQKAIDAFTQYKKNAAADKKAVVAADKAIESCHNAVALMSAVFTVGPRFLG